MVVIRLARQGRKKYSVYRIVAADKRRAATSKFLEVLGTYNPHTKEIVLKEEEIQKYLDNGAQASDRVLRILKSEGVKLPSWAKIHDRNKAPKKPEDESTSKEKPIEKTEVTEVSADIEKKAEAVKEDVGTVKELEDKANETKAQQDSAAAAEDTAQEQKEEKTNQ